MVLLIRRRTAVWFSTFNSLIIAISLSLLMSSSFSLQLTQRHHFLQTFFVVFRSSQLINRQYTSVYLHIFMCYIIHYYCRFV